MRWSTHVSLPRLSCDTSRAKTQRCMAWDEKQVSLRFLALSSCLVYSTMTEKTNLILVTSHPIHGPL
ncbi:hypothetical protein RND71_013233 [Anisodus tanguticus]|uniref:Uncharacterized protein n=1 Tax=Anisodus tanguticus TaxID=243964 RepID=A0AAE1SIL5_9SOLA|nr:hypothetical protein RND71_013233 [Anisodus tanguticus]